jgi:hypothetical protein
MIIQVYAKSDVPGLVKAGSVAVGIQLTKKCNRSDCIAESPFVEMLRPL